MPKYLIDVDDIKAAHWHTRKDLKKMFSNAKKAVEITTDHMETYDEPDMNTQRINGKPVTLYAVEEKKI